jgi:hypothetical protein
MGYDDKTEFDVFIVAENTLGKSVLLIIEVKCYSDLKINELIRQQYHLNRLQTLFYFENFYYIVLIAEDNVKNAKGVFRKGIDNELKKDVFVISWQDLVKPYLSQNPNRFSNECFTLSKKVNKESGKGGKKRVVCRIPF